MCMAMSSRGETGDLVPYGDFADVLFSARFTVLKNQILAQTASGIEFYLMDLCEAEERDGLRRDAVGGGNDVDELGLSGMLTVRQMQSVLTNARQLVLSRLQVLAVMSLVNGEERSPRENVVDYHAFVPVAALTIEGMLSEEAVARQAELIQRAELTPVELLAGRERDEVNEELTDLFLEFDEDENGVLDPQEFRQCLRAFSFGLSDGEITALLLAADENNDGTVDYREFMNLAYDVLIHLMREKRLWELQAEASNAALQAQRPPEGWKANEWTHEAVNRAPANPAEPRTYYFNHRTGDSRWSEPNELYKSQFDHGGLGHSMRPTRIVQWEDALREKESARAEAKAKAAAHRRDDRDELRRRSCMLDGKWVS